MFDPSLYVRRPILDVAGAIALGRALVSACPAHPTPEAARALGRLKAALADLSAEQAAAPATHPDARPLDGALDAAWAALRDRLVAYAALPARDYPKAPRAAEIAARLFPGGLAFLRLPYVEEWAESDRLLRVVDAERLAKDIDLLAGKDFLEHVRAAHAAYGDGLAITRAAPPASAPKLASALAAVRRRIAAYATAVVAMADEEVPATVAAVEAALAPLDAHRAAVARRAQVAASGPGTSPAAASPVPEKVG